MKTPTIRLTKSRGEKTRQEILRAGVDIASAQGLEGLTIGRLAKETGMSKSGLFSHFGSKQDLQLATLGAASLTFVEQILDTTEDLEPGLKKLSALLHAWILSLEKSSNRGGCFFFAVSAEMDDRPGKVRDLVAELTKSWVTRLENEAMLAVRLAELEEDCDIDLLVFQLHGFVQEANWFYRLHEDERAFEKARTLVFKALKSCATDNGQRVLNEIRGDQ